MTPLMIRERVKGAILRLMGFPQPRSLVGAELALDEWSFVEPVFVLSTGRCGTKWLTQLLGHSGAAHVNHSDYPELVRQSALAYRNYDRHPEMFHEILRACRNGYVAQAQALGQTYVETNNRITFFAYACKHVYPRARFLHLVRHPAAFVRSGLRRRWYDGVAHDEGRITHPDHLAWQDMTEIERIAWLWNETNAYVETFCSRQEPGTVLRVRAEDMFARLDVSRQVLGFVGVESFSDRVIERMLRRRVNAQHGGRQVDVYETWTSEEKDQLRRHVPLAAHYHYDL